jgi:salicylate hydroxylase
VRCRLTTFTPPSPYPSLQARATPSRDFNVAKEAKEVMPSNQSETSMSGKIRIGIVGAGIGGLTLALALRQRGLDADVYEQAPELREIGAAVSLSANGSRELERLGCLDALAASAAQPSEVIWREWHDGCRVAAFPIARGAAYRSRFGAPFCNVHRSDLQRVLAAAYGHERLRLGHQLVSLSEKNKVVTLKFADRSSAEVDFLVGADGQRSVVRSYVAGEERTTYSGTSGFRGVVPVRDLPSLPDPQALQFWMGPNAHVLHYAIGPRAQDINFLAVVEGPGTWTHESWVTPIAHDEVIARFSGWHPAVTEMICAAQPSLRWGLFSVRPLQTWQRGRVVLMGDAAHGMLPHHGQGANLTIEDAITLAELLRACRLEEFGDAMQSYQMLRRARTRIVQRSAHATNAVLHLSDATEGRAATLARVPERFGWIHAFDALDDVASRSVRATARAGGFVRH